MINPSFFPFTALNRDRLLAVLRDPAARGWPQSAKVKVTGRCNLRCIMCEYWRDMPATDAIPDERLRELLHELRELGVKKIHFSGGELFLRVGILEILALAAGPLGFRVNITTNGTLPDGEMVKTLAGLGLNGLSLSLDSPMAGTHDRIRGVRGAFEKSTRFALRFQRSNLRRKKPAHLRLNLTLNRLNFRDLRQLPGLLEKIPFTAVQLIPVDAPAGSRLGLTKRLIREYNDTIGPLLAKESRVVNPFPFGESKSALNASKRGEYGRDFYRTHPCLAPWLHLFISEEGEVEPCCMGKMGRLGFGNILKSSLAEIYQGEGYRAFRRACLEATPGFCLPCDDFFLENSALTGWLNQAGEGKIPSWPGQSRFFSAPVGQPLEEGLDSLL